MSQSSDSSQGPGAKIAARLQTQGIRDAKVLNAIRSLNRASFIPPDHRQESDDDRAIAIGLEQTISQPFMVAIMTQELALTGKERVLEIGTGSGYQTAVLSQLAAEVYTVERLPLLSLRARGQLDGLGLTNIHYRIGDGTLGWPETAPYDRIIVTAGAPELPPALFRQLAEEGLLVAPIGDEEEQKLTIVLKRHGQPWTHESIACRFVKLIGEGGWSVE